MTKLCSRKLLKIWSMPDGLSYKFMAIISSHRSKITTSNKALISLISGKSVSFLSMINVGQLQSSHSKSIAKNLTSAFKHGYL